MAADIRRISPTVPIIILTARDSESDQVLGLEMGADDYVTKPFSPLTLIARIKALRRRVQLSGIANKAEQVTSEFDIQTSHFKLNSKTREAYLNGNLISNLTPKEFDLLKTLASKPKQVFTGSSSYSWFGITNFTVMSEPSTPTLKSSAKKLKRWGQR